MKTIYDRGHGLMASLLERIVIAIAIGVGTWYSCGEGCSQSSTKPESKKVPTSNETTRTDSND